MKTVPKTIQVLIFIAILSTTLAHHFTGTYQDQQGTVVIMDHKSDGQIQGTVQIQGQQFQLQAQGNQQGAFGVIQNQANQGQGGQFGFQAQISPDLKTLQMTLYPPNAQGQPDTSRAQNLTLQRTENVSPTNIPTEIPVPVGPNNPGSSTNNIPQVTDSPPSGNSGNPLALTTQTEAGWAGNYSDGELTMTLQNANTIYQGILELGGAEYPLQARESMTGLDGVFLSGDTQFEFTVVRQADNLLLTTGGQEYVLTVQAPPKPVNPLGN